MKTPDRTVERRAYSYEQLAEAWGCSVTFVKKLVREEQLQAFKLGRRVMIPTSSVEAAERRFLSASKSAS